MACRCRAKVFVITGASEGIGAEFARQLAMQGHRLVLAARSEAALEAAEDDIAVTVVYPGVVATEMRRSGRNGRDGHAGVCGLDEADAMPLDECVMQIFRVIQGRRREWEMTRKARLGLWLKRLAPGWVDNLARKCLRQE